jgi:cytochrome c oxidase cbb3-type subunit 3
MMISKYKTRVTLPLLMALAGYLPQVAYAEQVVNREPGTDFNSQDMLRYALSGIMLLLLAVIAVLGGAVISAGKMYWEKEKKNTGTLLKTLMIPVLLGVAHIAGAQEASAQTVTKASWLPADIGVMLIFLALEFLVIFVLARMLQHFLRTKAVEVKNRKAFRWKMLFGKLSQPVSAAEEQALDLHHDYDGIRELDNKIPSWWRYAFYASIVFGGIYLYRMFVSETLPDQFRELQAANHIAAIQKEAYLRNAANNVDENNVTLLDASAIAEGAMLFSKNCQACHGDKGQGGVGPNLTDDYWLHSGSLKDIFKSIKYGWQEKGMKAWKDDFSPQQIAQLSSYVKSIQGSNPPAAKEPQGTLYTEASTTSKLQDTTSSTQL